MTIAGVSLSTERLTLRPWHVADAPRLLEMRGNPELTKWLGSPKPWRDVDQALNEIAIWNQRNNADDPFGTWAIISGADIVGSTNLSRIRMGDEVEVGWYLHPDAVGHGYATEAAAAVLEHGLDHGVPRIWALMWRNNFASAKVARSAGMRDLGVLVDPWYGSEEDRYSQMFVTY